MKAILTTILAVIVTVAHCQLSAVSINLYAGNNLMDGVALFYNNQSDTVDLFDLRKINNPSANIAVIHNTDTLASEQRTTYRPVQLRCWNLVAGEQYSLIIKPVGVANAFLVDSSRYIPVGNGLVYPFIPLKTGTNRFRIEFCTVLSINEPVEPPVRYGGSPNYTVYNILGQIIYKGKMKPVGAFKKVNEEIYIKIQ